MDFRFFHLNLYDNGYNFYSNGILYDAFILEYFYNYSELYTTANEGEYDLKFYVTLYLYKSLFQNVEYTKIQKNREEIFYINLKKATKLKVFMKKLILNHTEII